SAALVSVRMLSPGTGFASMTALTSAADTLEGVAGRTRSAQPLTAESNGGSARSATRRRINRIIEDPSHSIDRGLVGETLECRLFELIGALPLCIEIRSGLRVLLLGLVSP